MRAQQDGDLLVISNRGPFGFTWRDGQWDVQPAAGGLASTLTPLMRQGRATWMCCVPKPDAAPHARHALAQLVGDAIGGVHVVPILLPTAVYDSYYSVVSNEILWMLQHQLLEANEAAELVLRHQNAWDTGYLEANCQIAAGAASAAADVRAILVQDYHLYPLPALLRAACPGVPILHFTHIPFVPPSTWRLIPHAWPRAILRGILGANLVGFQTFRDVLAFVQACEDLLGLPVKPLDADGSFVVDAEGRPVVVRSYPVSVDPSSLRQAVQTDEVQAARERLAPHADRRIVVRADRLDPAKNQLDGFRAFGRLLELRPDLRRTVRFVACLVSSRTGLRAYQEYRAAVLQVVDEINTRYATECGGPPIVVAFETTQTLALAAMERCDVLFANSLADGMNLVPKEWAVVAQRDGVAVISETTGVAVEATGSALLVDPRDVEATARALADALDMPRVERVRRLDRFRQRVAAWTSRDWLATQLADLDRCPGVGGRLDGWNGDAAPALALTR